MCPTVRPDKSGHISLKYLCTYSAKNMTLTSKDTKKARVYELLSQGMTKKQIADELGISERTIRRWVNSGQDMSQVRKDTLNKIVHVEQTGQNFDEHNSEVSKTSETTPKEEYVRKLREYREINTAIADMLMQLGMKILNVVKASAENLSEKEITTIRQLETAYKVGSHAANQGSELMTNSLAVDDLLQKLEEFHTTP